MNMMFTISRPRFWLYIVGPFLIGSVASGLYRENVLIFIYGCIYFLFPANLFLYGVNDYFDSRIDTHNPKKREKEKRMVEEERRKYKSIIMSSLFLSLPLFIFSNETTRILLVVFFFLSFFYSATPIRFKTRQFLDFSSNVLYAIPGFIGYSLNTDMFPPFIFILAAFCWTGAMHLFSAIVDIQADTNAGIQTTATQLGEKKSLLLCSILWFGAFILALSINSFLLIGIFYPLIPLVLLIRNDISLEKTYWKFPYINALFGFVLFLVALKIL